MAKQYYAAIVSAVLMLACEPAAPKVHTGEGADGQAKVTKTDSAADLVLTGAWHLTMKGVTGGDRIIMSFKKNNVAVLSGPDSEFEHLKWQKKDKRLILRGFKKSEDSRWTFRDSVFTIVAGADGVNFAGKRQKFRLRKL